MRHYICINDEYTTCDDIKIPFGKIMIEEKMTHVIDDMLDYIVPNIKDGEVILSGRLPARRMLGRKLEDRLGREVKY